MNLKENSYIRKTHHIVNQFGINPIKFYQSLVGLMNYFKDYFLFSRSFNGTLKIMPCLHDRYQESGSTKGEYFWQDLIVARMIFQNNPKKHVDIGSRVDGFVAHVASYREIEVVDIRPMSNNIPGVTFIRQDMLEDDRPYIGDGKKLEDGYCDSISCLHAIEHFGLGRYGDSIDVNGLSKGIKKISSLLITGGNLYLSAPIGIERVEFNANWVFNPQRIINEAKVHGLLPIMMGIITKEEGLIQVDINQENIIKLNKSSYELGFFKFIKIN